MEARELRIGNLLSFVGAAGYVESSVTGFTNNGKIWFIDNPKDEECAWEAMDVKPIPLTEEQLVRFGFEKHYFGFWDNEDLNGVILNGDTFAISYNHKWGLEFCYGELAEPKGVGHIQYVHQVQNLVHALTGTELTIKETAAV